MTEQLRYGFIKTPRNGYRPYLRVPGNVSDRLAHSPENSGQSRLELAERETLAALGRLTQRQFGIIEVKDEQHQIRFDQLKRWKGDKEESIRRSLKKSVTKFITGMHIITPDDQKDQRLTMTASSLPIKGNYYGLQALVSLPPRLDVDDLVAKSTREMQAACEYLNEDPNGPLRPRVTIMPRRGVEIAMNGGVVGTLRTERVITHQDGSSQFMMKGEHFTSQDQQLVAAIGLIALAHPEDIA